MVQGFLLPLAFESKERLKAHHSTACIVDISVLKLHVITTVFVSETIVIMTLVMTQQRISPEK